MVDMILSRFCFLALALVLATGQAHAANRVQVISTPEKGQVPDAEVDREGIIHIAYVAGKDAWYVNSSDEGKTFSMPLRINSDIGTVHPPNMFRGPDLAIGRNGRVHVIWYVSAYQRKLPQDQWGVFYSWLDAGKSEFVPNRNLNHKPSDNYSLAADDKGNVAVVWMAGKLVVSFSEDNGITFKDLAVPIADPCECCGSRALFSGDSLLSIAYREKANNMRDMHLLRKERNSSTFTRQKISGTPWQVNGCPMTGVFLSDAKGGPLIAWETKGAVSFARLQTADPISAPREVKAAPKGKWPVALAAADGTILVSWKSGNTVFWQLRDSSDKPIGEIESKPSANPHRHAAVVTKAQNFLIID